VYTLALVPPSGVLTFTVIGTELGLLEAPVNGVGALTIGPGERYDVVVNFGGLATNDEVLLQNSAGAPFPNGIVDLTDVMKFRVTASTGDTDPLPATLRTVTPLDPGSAIITRDLVLKRSGLDDCGRQSWQIDGRGWNEITEFPVLGTTEVWRFINDSGVSHPMHMHLVAFQIVNREAFTKGPGGEIIPNGSPQLPPAEQRGWKDTALVAPNEILRVIARFDDYAGLYPYHCHMLEHEDNEMMRQFQTVTDTDGDGVGDPSDNCPTVANAGQQNFDADMNGDACDACETIVDDGTDGDMDGVPDACDSCTAVTNGAVAGSPTTNRSFISHQRDDDVDGRGNSCDFDYNNAGATVTATDFNDMKASVGKLMSASNCGQTVALGGSGNTQRCGEFDHDGGGATVTATDFNATKAALGKVLGARCAACSVGTGWSNTIDSAGARLGRPVCQSAVAGACVYAP
jgi:hypothetical protein